MSNKFSALVLAAAWFGAGAPDARAVIIISNLNGNDGTQSADIDNLRNKGMGFTMPGGTDYTLDNVILRLRLTGTAVTPILQVWSNGPGNVPAAPLITLSNPAFTATGISNYTFTPPSAFTLQAGTTYWLVLSGTATGAVFDWMASSPALLPTGLATHFASTFDQNGVPPTTPSTILTSYAINATPAGAAAVPAPAGVALAGAAAVTLLGYRRLRTGPRRG